MVSHCMVSAGIVAKSRHLSLVTCGGEIQFTTLDCVQGGLVSQSVYGVTLYGVNCDGGATGGVVLSGHWRMDGWRHWCWE